MFTNKSEEVCGKKSMDLLTVWLGFYSLLVPLFIYILFMGYRQCTSKVSASVNSDVFTLNIIVMEILNVVGMSLFCGGYYSENPLIHAIGQNAVMVAITGQAAFHNFICLERYLAVVHPIMYLHLNKSGAVKVRNISIGAWMVTVFVVTVTYFYGSGIYQFVYTILQPTVSIVIVCFCTASVLCVLIRPRPGEVGGDRRALDQSKRMAFYTMMATLGALMSRFIVFLTSFIVYFLPIWDMDIKCVMVASAYWFSLPSSLILPLLFLRRAGKLCKCK